MSDIPMRLHSKPLVIQKVFKLEYFTDFFENQENLYDICDAIGLHYNDVEKFGLDLESVLSPKDLDVDFKSDSNNNEGYLSEVLLSNVIVTVPLHIKTFDKHYKVYVQLELEDTIEINLDNIPNIDTYLISDIQDIDYEKLNKLIISYLEDYIDISGDIWYAIHDDIHSNKLIETDENSTETVYYISLNSEKIIFEMNLNGILEELSITAV